MRVHHLNCGTICPPFGRLTRGKGSLLSRGHMICHCLLIETNDGLVLVDTGIGLGDIASPRERLGAGFVAEIENYQKLVIHRGRKATTHSYNGKGHAEQMAAWAAFLRGAAEHPLPYEQSRQSMMLTFAVLESIQAGRSVEVA